MNLSYSLSLSSQTRCFTVQIKIENCESNQITFKLPTWTPGSYLIREYGRLIQGFRAFTDRGNPLPWKKVSKNGWQVDSESVLTVEYQVFSNDLTVRTNHINSTHGYCNGAATFMYVDGQEHLPSSLQIILPQTDWRIATALPPQPDRENWFEIDNFDTLVDSPIEIGIHERIDFEVLGKPHHFVIWGQGNHVSAQIVEDTKKIINQTSQLFGPLPYDRYWFLLHLSPTGNGGLEHRDCCSLNYNPLGFRGDGYLRFLNLVAHEFFHTWNVKRLRPQEFIQIDYDRENYTRLLWFAEGITSYYDQLIPLRCGLYDQSHFLKIVSENITRYFLTPGRWEQPLAEASFDSWIKLYRPDANTTNIQISYYLKGDIVAMLLDLLIRARTQSSLDQVMQVMWQNFGQSELGFNQADVYGVISTIGGAEIVAWLDLALHTTTELDFDFCLQPFGLKLFTTNPQTQPPHVGMNVKTANGSPIVQFVEAKGPAQLAGINPGDELLAINGLRVNADNLSDRLRDFAPGDTIEVSLFQRDELQTVTLNLTLAPPDRYSIAKIANPSIIQQDNLRLWLGA